jgi:hypothetical protein
MRLRIILAVAILLAACFCVVQFTRGPQERSKTRPAQSAEKQEKGRTRLMQYLESAPSDAVPGLFVVLAETDADHAGFLAGARADNLEIRDECPALRMVLVNAADGPSREKLAAILPARSSVEYDFALHLPDAEVEADPAEAFGAGFAAAVGAPSDPNWGRGAVVALLDDRVLPHPELAGADIVSFPDASLPLQTKPGHADAMASILCGRGSVAGVAPSLKLLNFVVASQDGAGDSYRIAKALSQALDAGASVLCCQRAVRSDSRAIRLAVSRIRDANAALVVPADPSLVESYPSSIEGVLSVAAIGRTGVVLGTPQGFSVAAPGSGLVTAGPDGGTATSSGPGASAALVAGALAGIVAENPGLGAARGANLLCDYAARSGLDDSFGAGIVDVARVRQRSTPGIRDIAVTGVDFAPDSAGAGSARIAVQNKGTATTAFTLEVTASGRLFRFSNPGLPGNQFAIYTLDVPEGDGHLSAEALTQAQDVNPANNVYVW